MRDWPLPPSFALRHNHGAGRGSHLQNTRSLCDNYSVEYQIILTVEEKRWTADVPALPGCITWADSKEEALRLAHEAIEGWIASRKRLNKPVPRARQRVELVSVRVG